MTPERPSPFRIDVRSCLSAASLLVLPLMSVACAQTSAPVADIRTTVAEAPLLPQPSRIEASGVFGGQAVDYVASLSPLSIQADEDGKGAEIWSWSYVATGENIPDNRPVIFAFNGGPIAASTWLHIGALGPSRVQVPDDLSAPLSEFELVPNDYSPLDVADLVFYDPASTGFSTVAEGVDPKVYYTVEDDAYQLVRFIQSWLKANDRVGSPVFLLGESYGTMRAAVAAGQLAAEAPVYNAEGVFLMGQAVNMVEYSQRRENIISYVVSLPTLASTAWELGLIDQKGRDFETFMAEVEAFGGTDYLLALYQGNRVSDDVKANVASRLADLTGIPESYYLDNNLRISKEQFRRELLKDDGKILGRSDARYIGDVSPDGRTPDPSGIVGAAYDAAFKTYAAEAFGVEIDENYVSVANTGGWYYGAPSPFSHFAFGAELDLAFDANPDFRLFIGNGYQDTMTTVGAAEYAVMQSNWPVDRVRTNYYQGGHMAYSVEESAAEFGDDVRAWVRGWPTDSE